METPLHKMLREESQLPKLIQHRLFEMRHCIRVLEKLGLDRCKLLVENLKLTKELGDTKIHLADAKHEIACLKAEAAERQPIYYPPRTYEELISQLMAIKFRMAVDKA